MPNHALTIHYSGLTLDAQHRIMEMTHEILDSSLGDGEIDGEYLIAKDGEIEDPSYE